MTYDTSRSDNGPAQAKETKGQAIPEVWLDGATPVSGGGATRSFSDHEQINMSPQRPAQRAIPWPSDRSLAALSLDDIGVSALPHSDLDLAEPELRELMTSITYLGLSNPIVVQPSRTGSGFELIHGFRRLTAFRRLYALDGNDHWSKIAAFVVAPEKRLDELYRQKVDEDVMHRTMSFAQMARLAEAYAADPETLETEMSEVIDVLFRSMSRSRRDCIGAFVRLIRAFEGVLRFPAEIPRDLGILLDQKITTDPQLIDKIAADLDGWDNRSLADELGVLGAHADRRNRSALDDQGANWRPIDSQFKGAEYRVMGGTLEVRLDKDLSTCEDSVLAAALSKVLHQLALTASCP